MTREVRLLKCHQSEGGMELEVFHHTQLILAFPQNQKLASLGNNMIHIYIYIHGIPPKTRRRDAQNGVRSYHTLGKERAGSVRWSMGKASIDVVGWVTWSL